MKFFKCEHCGNLIGLIHDAGVPMICCGQKMTLLEAKTSDEGNEKHLPVVEKIENQVDVKVGSVPHPMLEKHFIQWVYVETEKGGQRKAFKPGQEAAAQFTFVDDKPLAVYEYCNLHGLWKTVL